MRYSFYAIIFLSQICLAKIKIDELLVRNKSNRKVAQFDLMAKSQDRLNSFIKCSQNVSPSTSPLESDAAKCIQDQFYGMQSSVSVVHYFSWFQSNTKISLLYPCTGELLSFAQDFQQQPKDLFYCVTTKSEGEIQSGIISFRVKEEQLKILKIKLM